MLHGLSRRAIHSSETLQVTIAELERMQRQFHKLYEDCEPQWLDDHIQMFHALLSRPNTNKERLSNEISLVRPWRCFHACLSQTSSQTYNLIAQRDSKVLAALGKAAQSDSSAMKTVAIITMASLPATFISVSTQQDGVSSHC